MPKIYRVLKDGNLVETPVPGKYAGHRGYKIFGTLTCEAGKRMKRENRVFFLTLEDAVLQGYRPCKLCKPLCQADFEKIRGLVPYRTLEEFYNSGRQFK